MSGGRGEAAAGHAGTHPGPRHQAARLGEVSLVGGAGEGMDTSV